VREFAISEFEDGFEAGMVILESQFTTVELGDGIHKT